MRTFFQDARYGLRTFLKSPGFTAVAVVALALGIGANTAVFSVLHAVLLRPLPYSDPARLVAVWETDATPGRAGNMRNEVALANFLDWREQNQVFEQLGALYDASVNLTGAGEPERVQGAVVTTNLFDVLGARPAAGRTFLAEEEQTSAPRAAVISDGLWRRRFGSDPNLLGQTLSMNGNPTTVVGIMPPDFQLEFPVSMQTDVWLPMRIDPANANRRSHYLYTLARLKEGVSAEQARAAMASLAGRLEQQYPATNANKGANVLPLHRQLVGEVRPYLYVLFGAVGFVLLIACANVANLLLVRAASRSREVAVRVALGATRGRLVRQFLTESVLLSALGGALGLLLASWGSSLLIALSPAEVPRLGEVGLHAQVFVWTLAISLLTGALFGLAPALQASRTDLNEALKEAGRRTSGGSPRSRTRAALVVAEVALALVLLVGAGLMVRSFLLLQRVSPGFETQNLLTMKISLPRQKYGDQQKANLFFEQLLERVRAVPGVIGAGGTDPLPLSGSNGTTGFVVEGGPALAIAERPEVGLRVVTPGFFEAMRVPVVRGRSFAEQDREDAPPAVVVNETMARRFFPGGEAVGRRIGFGENDKQVWREIVGVVGDVRHDRLDAEPKPELFLPYRQLPNNFMSLVVRTSSDPAGFAAAVRQQVRALDPDQPVFDIKTMDERLARTVAQGRFLTILLGVFSGLSLLLAAVGIYGVMSYVVTLRTHEIGVRMALGAQRRDILRQVVGEGLALGLAGVALGLAASFALTRLLTGIIYGVSATDPATFAAVSLALVATVLLACLVPARRATRVDPMVALRYE